MSHVAEMFFFNCFLIVLLLFYYNNNIKYYYYYYDYYYYFIIIIAVVALDFFYTSTLDLYTYNCSTLHPLVSAPVFTRQCSRTILTHALRR